MQINVKANNEADNRSSRLQTLQLLRFLACLLVLVTHAGFYTHERLSSSFDYWHRGSAGVVLFFVLSGFVMMIASERLLLQRSGFKIFLTRRLERIVPIYWIATTAKVAISLVAASQVLHAEFDISDVVKSYLFIPQYNYIDHKVQPFLGVGWTLIFEMFFYLIFSISLFFRLPRITSTAAFLVPLSVLYIFRDEMFSPIDQPLLYFLCDAVVLNFLFGMIVAKVYQKRINLGAKTAFAAVAIGMMSIVYDFFDALPSLIDIGLASALVVWGLVSLEARNSIKVPSWVVFLGDASYSIYLFHPLLAPIVATLFKKLGLEFPMTSTVIGVLVALLGGSIIHLLIERPITRLLSKRQLPTFSRTSK